MLRFLLPSPRIFQMWEITGLNIVKRLFIWFQFPAFFNSVISGCESYHSSSLIVSRQLSQLWRLSCRISSELLVLSVCVCGAFLVCFFDSFDGGNGGHLIMGEFRTWRTAHSTGVERHRRPLAVSRHMGESSIRRISHANSFVNPTD